MYKYYRTAAVYPTIIMLVLTLICSIIDNSGYKSEWLTSDAVIEMYFLLEIVFAVFMLLISLTIYFLKNQSIAKEQLFIFLVGYSIPFITAVMTIICVVLASINDMVRLSIVDSLYAIFAGVPYIIGQGLSYRQFVRDKNIG